jgi:hypothetical protein
LTIRSLTGSGVTGGSLVLTANPAGLPLGATQFANVTITSPDATVENQQTIRVGLFLSNTVPVSTGVVIVANNLPTSPVEPIVAIGANSTSVGIYDVNSGALLLPGNAYPHSIQCVWNGLVVGGIDGAAYQSLVAQGSSAAGSAHQSRCRNRV